MRVDFSECYALADIPANKVNAPYNELVNAVKSQIDSLGGCSALDENLTDFANNISLQKGEIVFKGSGFGYLNTVLGGKAPSHLEFVLTMKLSRGLTFQTVNR